MSVSRVIVMERKFKGKWTFLGVERTWKEARRVGQALAGKATHLRMRKFVPAGEKPA